MQEWEETLEELGWEGLVEVIMKSKGLLHINNNRVLLVRDIKVYL